MHQDRLQEEPRPIWCKNQWFGNNRIQIINNVLILHLINDIECELTADAECVTRTRYVGDLRARCSIIHTRLRGCRKQLSNRGTDNYLQLPRIKGPGNNDKCSLVAGTKDQAIPAKAKILFQTQSKHGYTVPVKVYSYIEEQIGSKYIAWTVLKNQVN